MNSRKNVADIFLSWWIPVLYFLVIIAFYLRTYDSCQIKITILQIGATIAIGVWLIRQLYAKNRVILPGNNTILVPVLAFLVSGIISFIISPFHGTSFMELIRRVFYIGLALIIMQQFTDEKSVRRLINFVIAGGVISCLYGIVQFIDMHFYPGPPEPGFDPFIWRMAFYPRVFSTMGNPGFWGDFLIILAPIVLALIIKTKNVFLKIFYITLFILVSFNLLITICKSEWTGYASGLTTFCILASICYYQKNRKIHKFFVGSLVTLILLIFLMVNIFVINRSDSIKFRVYTWLSTWEMIVKRPILGNGIGTFYLEYPQYRRPQIFFIEARHNTETDHPESEFLEVLDDEGIVGFGIFLWLIITFIIVGMWALRVYATSPPIEQCSLESSPPTENVKPGITDDSSSVEEEINYTHNPNIVSYEIWSKGYDNKSQPNIFKKHQDKHLLEQNNELVTQDKPSLFTDYRGYYLLGVLSSFIGVLIDNLASISLRFVSSGIFLGLLLGLIGSLSLTNKKNSSEEQEEETNNLQSKLFNKKTFLLKLLCSGIIVVSALYLINMFVGVFRSDMEHNLGIFFSKRGQWNNALTHYCNVNRYDPYFIMSHYFMGNVFNDRLIMDRSHHPEWGDREVDKPTYEKLVKQYAHDIELGNREFRLNSLSGLYEEYRNDAQRSIDKYDDVKKIAPNYVQVHHQVGLLYMKLGDQAKSKNDKSRAKDYFEKALENFYKYQNIDPIFAQNYVRIAYIYLQLGDLAKAEQTYREHIDSHLICKTGPNNVMWEDWSPRRRGEYSESAVNLGKLLFDQHRIKEAEDSYNKAIELNPNSIQAWHNLAILYGKTQRLREAAKAWKKVLQLNPNDEDAKSAVKD